MKLTRVAVVALLGIFLAASIACGSSSTPNPTPAPGWVTYTEDIYYGFSVFIPDSWSSQMGSSELWFLFFPHELCAGNAPYVGVLAQPSGYTNVQDYYSALYEPINEEQDEYQLISKENLTIDGVSAIKVIYSYDDNGVDYHEMNCVLIKQQENWEFRATCVSSCWDTYKYTFDTIANSFHVLD